MKWEGAVIGVFIGFFIGIGIYVTAWMASYIVDLPWWVAAAFDILDVWIIGKLGITPSIWMIIIPTLGGAILGIISEKI